jgi:hypothetical protein
MPKLPSPCVERNPLVRKHSIIFRRTRRNHLGLTTFQERTRRTLTRIILTCGGVCDWPVRRLASACGISVSQFQKDARVICGLGLIERIYRRKTVCRNESNLWKIGRLAEGGVGVINAGEKQEIISSTSTPRSVEHGSKVPVAITQTARPAYSRSAENHDPAFRRLVEYKQRLEAENRGLRAIHRGRDHDRRQRMAMQAQVGMPHTFEPQVPLTPEQEALEAQYRADRKRMEAQEAARRAAEAEKQAQKRQEQREWWESQRLQPNEPLSAEMQAKVDRLNRIVKARR